VLSKTVVRGDLHRVSRDSAREGPMVPSRMMPTKRYGMMAAGRPALFLGSPEETVARILRTDDAGVTLGSARPERFAARVQSLKDDPRRLAAMGRNARRAFDRTTAPPAASRHGAAF
jgi:hypothetical protein